MTDHEKALLEAYERGYAKGVEDERQRAIGRDPDMFRVHESPVYGPINWPQPQPIQPEPGMVKHTVTCDLLGTVQ